MVTVGTSSIDQVISIQSKGRRAGIIQNRGGDRCIYKVCIGSSWASFRNFTDSDATMAFLSCIYNLLEGSLTIPSFYKLRQALAV